MAEYIERDKILGYMDLVVIHARGVAGNDPISKKVTDIVAGMRDIVAMAPAADVAPVMYGRWQAQKYWKYENKHSIQYHTNRCSLCHCDVSSRLLYNYCPNCGAKMKDGG